MRAKTLLLAALPLLAPAAARTEPAATERWKEISAIPDRKTHLVPSTWGLDKYPDAPLLTARSKVTLLDQDGPGVVTQIHVSDYLGSNNRLVLRVYNPATRKGKAPALQPFVGGATLDVPYRSCIYYYAAK
jgi:hypothetical protein